MNIKNFIIKYEEFIKYCTTLSSYMNNWTKEQRKTWHDLKYECSILGLRIPLGSFIKKCRCRGKMHWDHTDKGRAALCDSCVKEELFIRIYEENN